MLQSRYEETERGQETAVDKGFKFMLIQALSSAELVRAFSGPTLRPALHSLQ